MVRNGFGSLQAHRIVLQAFHLRVACPSTDGTPLQRARPFLQLSPPHSEGGRGTRHNLAARIYQELRCVSIYPR